MNRFLKYIPFVMALLLLFSCYKDNEEELYGNTNCNTAEVSFSKDIQPLVQAECATSGCHVQGGNGIIFENYQNVKDKVDKGSLKNRVVVLKDMPPNSSLSSCQIAHVEAWINAGAPNN
jgi:hypothetical protein